MRFFDIWKQPDINKGLKAYQTTSGAILLDVRTPQEYAEGHIAGSRNIPLQTIDRTAEIAADKNTPLFVHCLSGRRSRQAAAALKQMGYTNVTNIGGIAGYHGKVER